MHQRIESKGNIPILYRWAITISVILFLVIYQLGIRTSPAEASISPIEVTKTEIAMKMDETEEIVETISSGPYQDGEYVGSSDGYGGPVVIKLSIENGWIKDITIDEAYGEGVAYLRDARKLLPRVIEKQNTDIDAVSGATVTSYAILDAIDAALFEGNR